MSVGNGQWQFTYTDSHGGVGGGGELFNTP